MGVDLWEGDYSLESAVGIDPCVEGSKDTWSQEEWNCDPVRTETLVELRAGMAHAVSPQHS